ncbi:MAG: OmpH family outer membrane protein [Synergistaceae bacterium]|jgi:outer membrane protein|nr:OmpH family outer membrane protein [Synergistaceae bacterium]
MSRGKKFAAAFMIALLAMSWAYTSAFAAAAAAPEEKVGAVDPRAVWYQHPKYEQTLQQLKNITDQKTNEAKTAIDKEPDNNKKAEIYRNMQMTLAEEEAKLMQPLFQDIDIAIRAVANAKKITVVVDKTALFYGAVDITDDVVQELKKKSASGG